MENDSILRIKKDVVKAARRAYSIGLQGGTGGNLSARIANQDIVLIKQSGCSFGECTIENLVVVDMAGNVLSGSGKPSKELLTHLAIYRNRPTVHGIFHCHSTWAIVCAETEKEIPIIAYHSMAKIGWLPVLDVDGHADRNVERAVEQLLIENPELKAFIQRRHGIFTLAGNIVLAEHNAELVDETAKIAWLSKHGGLIDGTQEMK